MTDSLYSTSWDAPVTVALYPINADGSEVTADYIGKLTQSDFAPLESFLHEEATEYGVKQDRPLRFTLAPTLAESPPPLPRERSGFNVMLWSLQLRWWAWRTPPKPPGPTPRIRLFLKYYDPSRISVLDHSTGLEKGLIGVLQLFADRKAAGTNHVVIAHELLHTVGATDKYDAGNLPRYPEGYAEPDVIPRYPQRFAELMGGRVPVSATEATIPTSLKEVLIGPATAKEIGWTK
jgi:hypothetical protein